MQPRPSENVGDDDFDVASFSAIRKEQKDGLERLENHFNGSQAAIESQVRGEVDQLFQQFQLGMQHLYTNLTKTVSTTIDTQVQLRLEQERLRRDHDEKKAEINARYRNEVSKLIISTSTGGRQSNPTPQLPSHSLVPSQGPITNQDPLSNHSHTQGRGYGPSSASTHRSSSFTATDNPQNSPAPASVNKTQSLQGVQQRPLASDDRPKERFIQQPMRHEYTASLPTPLATPEELTPQQRRQVSSKSRAFEPRATPSEPRHVEPRDLPSDPRQIGPRAMPHEQRNVESRAVASETRQVRPLAIHPEPRHVEPRAVAPEPRYFEPRAVPSQPRHVEPRAIEPRPIESRFIESRPTEQHGAEPRIVETLPVEPLAQNRINGFSNEQQPPEPLHIEVPSQNRPNESPPKQQPIEPRPDAHRSVEHRQTPQPHTESDSTRHTGAHSIDEEAEATEQKSTPASSIDDADRPSRQEIKRKAAELSTSTTVAPSSKRPRTRDRTVQEGPAEPSPRSTRRSSGADKVRVTRTIPFEEVYQNGKAQFKHKIFMWPKDSGDWYIVRCDEHQVHFNIAHPKHGAAKHVHSPQHGGLEKKHDLAMEICGHLVLGCNAELAELNNCEFQRALDEDNYQVFNMNLLTKEGKRRLTNTPAKATDTDADVAYTPEKNADTPASAADTPVTETKPLKGGMVPKKRPSALTNSITRPEPCKFYLGYWGPTKKYYMLIMLPIRKDGSLREVGLREKLQETDLISNVPKCYRSDRLSLQITGFQSAYKDGGAKADKREYPVMFFDSPVQKHSLSWLPASKLKPVDLFNPPSDADKKQLAVARDWYAQRMMHRNGWEEFKRLGQGETPSPTLSEGEALRSEQWASLRSARTDEMSPIRDKSSGPGHFFGGSSEEGSEMGDDSDDPMTMDVGPIPEPADSNYVEEDSGMEDSDAEMEVATPNEKEDEIPQKPDDNDVTDVIRPSRRRSTARSSSQYSNILARTEEAAAQDELSADPKTHKADRVHAAEPPTPPAEIGQQREVVAADLEQDQLRSSAQAKAVAAIKEAASRGRASSESPGQQSSRTAQPTQSAVAPLPPPAEISRSRSEDTLVSDVAKILASAATSKLYQARETTDLVGVSDKTHSIAQVAQPTTDSYVDPYKRFAAIRAERAEVSKDQLSRAASVPANALRQPTPNASQTLSPPLSQSSIMVPARSLSTTPTDGAGSNRQTPRIVIPEAGAMGRWQAVRASSQAVGTSTATPVQPETQLGTPILDKQEVFDVSQFYRSDGLSWARAGSNDAFLRLVTDPMRKWAETVRGSPLQANIEPLQIERIETDYPDESRGKQRVKLFMKSGRTLMLMFETNEANGRAQAAAVQGRKLVSWVQRINGSVEWNDDTGRRPNSRREADTTEKSAARK